MAHPSFPKSLAPVFTPATPVAYASGDTLKDAGEPLEEHSSFEGESKGIQAAVQLAFVPKLLQKLP
jgi:hypothetical protein